MPHRGILRRAGFTLLEVLIVLVIGAVAYVLVLSLPSRGASSADLKAAARTLAAGLRQAQTMAMSQRRDSALTVDVETREFDRQIAAAVAKLPARQRAAIALTYDKGMSNAEVADVLDTTVSAVETLLARGKQNLRQQLGSRLDED